MHNIFLIGGSPSSGSTLLVNLLNSHSNVIALPETGLFVHGENLTAGNTSSDNLNLNIHLPWINTGEKVAQAIGLDPETYDHAVNKYPTAFDLLRAYVNPDKSSYLIEKTPENIFAFYTYLSASPKNRVVVTIRDALSVTQSLVRRGFTIAESLLIWFGHSYETARIVRDFSGQVYQCTYENLTKNPSKTVDEIMEFWGIGKQLTKNNFSGPDLPPTSDEADNTYDDSEMIDFLVDYSSWNLAGTAWTKSPDANVQYTEPVNLLGLNYQLLAENLIFKTEHDGFLKVTALEDFVLGREKKLDSDTITNATPTEIPITSEFIRCLVESYRTYISKA